MKTTERAKLKGCVKELVAVQKLCKRKNIEQIADVLRSRF